MAFNFYDTYNLLMAVQQLTPPSTFLRDRYFPTNDTTDVFSSTYVLAEYKDGSKRLAPFVAPRKGGVTMLRQGYEMRQYEPPFIAPRRMLTVDNLKKRGFGEALLSNLTPEQRQRALLLSDAQELSELISRREEAMAAEVMQTNGCIMKHIADEKTESDDMEVRFYTEGSNPAQFTPDVKWDQSTAKILADLEAMVRLLTGRGLPAADLVCAPDVADVIVRNPEIVGLLDNRRYEMGSVEPSVLAPGAAVIARLNVLGRMINIISYDETYTDDDGDDQPFITSGNCILTAPGAGRTLYGAVNQVEQSDGEFHTYTGRRVPKYISNAEGNTRTITLTSCPLLVPNNKNPFIVASVLT